MIYDRPYMIEILTPRTNTSKPHGEAFERFRIRYLSILESVYAVSIPDNPLGTLRVSAVDTLTLLKLPVESEKVLMNVNTFHSKDSLDLILRGAYALGIRYLLVVRGDGGPLMQVLKPADIGVDTKLVTSGGLLSYINREFKGTFITGAAFNQYKPISIELKKLEKKNRSRCPVCSNSACDRKRPWYRPGEGYGDSTDCRGMDVSEYRPLLAEREKSECD